MKGLTPSKVQSLLLCKGQSRELLFCSDIKIVIIEIDLNCSLTRVHFVNLFSTGAVLRLLILSKPLESWKSESDTFVRFNVTRPGSMHRTERKVGSLDLPDESGFEIDVAFYLGVLFFDLQIVSWLINDKRFKLLLKLGKQFVREARTTFADGLEAFEILIPTGE